MSEQQSFGQIPSLENKNSSSKQAGWPLSKRRLVTLALCSLFFVTICGALWATNRHSFDLAVLNPNAPQSSSSATPTPTLSQEEEQEQKLFASLPQSMLYYSFAQTNNARNVFQSNPTDTQRRTIDVGFPGGYQYLTSPDGQQFIRFSNKNVQWTSTEELSNFDTIFQAEGSSAISSVIYSSDSKQLAVITSQTLNDQSSNVIYRIDDNDPIAITTVIAKAPLKLVGYINTQSIWYATNDSGVLTDLTRYDLTSQRADSTTYALLNTGQLLSKMQFNNAMTYGYTSTATAVGLFNMTTRQSQTLYQIPTTCPSNRPNLSALTGFSPSLTADLALIANRSVPCGSQLSKATYNLMLINSQTGEVIRQVTQNAPFNNGYWSVKNDYTWLSLDAEHNYMVTLATLATQAIPDSERQNVTKEKLYFTGWLTGN